MPTQNQQQDQQTIFLKDYATSAYAISNVELDIEIEAKSTRVMAMLHITPAEGTVADTPLVLDGNELALSSIAIDGAPLMEDQYEVTENGLTVYCPPTHKFVLETEVFLAPEQNTKLMGLYRSSGVWCTQCEPEGFRRITYFLDRPDVLSRYKVRLSAPKTLAPVLLANGNLVESGDLPDEHHFAVWDDPHPKPSYLFAMVAGELDSIQDSFTTASGREVELGIFCEPGKQDQCAFAMDALKRSMVWDEKRFGREYDLDVFNIVAVSDFNFGAMENKGLNIFNDRYVLADPSTATDSDYANIERIIAHEYFHNWTGNRITCRDWFQLCLKEGLTVFRDQEFTSDERSRAVKRIEDVRGLRAAQFPEDGGPLAHPARPAQYREINNFYTATVYQKGAEIVRMLHTLLGEKQFRAGTDLYFKRHDGQATTIEAWLKVFEDSTGRDLSHFGKWYTQSGTPQVTISDEYDAATQTYKLTVQQDISPTPDQAEKQPMVLPIRFGLVGPNGHDMTWEHVTGAQVEGDLLVLDSADTVITFNGISSRPVPSLFREFSAPVNLTTDLSADDQLFLARHDSDPFNRWQALQDAAMSIMVGAVKAGGIFENVVAIDNLAAAYKDTLEADQLDNAFKAQALSLPSETALLQAVRTDIDPSLLRQVRKALMQKLSDAFTAALRGMFDSLEAVCVPYRNNTTSSAARSLRNQCLGWLLAGSDADAIGLAEALYQSADNMTDRMAALGLLVSNGHPAGDTQLAAFKQSYGDDVLVMDKWLALTAMRVQDDCLERIKAVYADPDFPRTNPNRLRSLAGTFAMGNLPQFARADGAGFDFITQFCREVDSANPQVAARVLTAFRIWRQFEPGRKELAERALLALKNGPPLSRNVTDILERTLG